MSRHRADPPPRRAPPRGRAERVRPRYGRLAVLGASVSVTGIAMLGGVGVLPSVAEGDGATAAHLGQVAADTDASPSAQPTKTTATGTHTASKQQATAP